MINCPRRGQHALPSANAAETGTAAQRRTLSASFSGGITSERDVQLLVAAALDACAPCVTKMRAAAVHGRHLPEGLSHLLTTWLSDAAARAEAEGGPLPETAAGLLPDARLSPPSRLLVALIPLAGPERPGGSARVLRSEVRRPLEQFTSADWPRVFDDALAHLVQLHRAA
jgi:hypothetical protein